MQPSCSLAVPRDCDLLLRLVSPRIDDRMLREIAAADYGRDVDEHFAPLRRLRDDGVIPCPLAWEPREVLELIRWSEPDDPEWGPGGHGVRGHWMRLFACTALLRTEFDPANIEARADGQNQTLAALLMSVRALDAKLDRPACGLVGWLVEVLSAEVRRCGGVPADDLAFFGVGLLWTIVRAQVTMEDAKLVDICHWIAACEAQANTGAHAGYGLPQGPWLLSTTHFNLNHAKWRRIGDDLGTAELAGRSAEARDWVRLIGSLIVGD
jgi:hypothetical protein